jgi:integrase
VLDWARVREYRSGENPARWRGHLDKILPKRSAVQKVAHHRALDYRKLPEFWAELQQREGIAAMALQWLILTGTRSGETLGAQWVEIDLNRAVWTIPAARMKAEAEHRVPLSPVAVAILQCLPRLDGNPYVFPGSTAGKPLSNMALLALLRRMNCPAVAHGFRSSFRDWASEETPFPHEVCEQALAHTISNAVEKAYRRGDLFDKRRELMNQWAEYLR